MATATAKAPKAPKAPAPPKLAAKPAVRPSAAVDFTVDRDALREIVDAARTVAKGGHMPIITYVRLAWTPDTLTASATDLVISYRSSRPCVASKPGDVCVPAAFFATIVASMPRGDLSVSVDPTSLRVSLKSAGARTASAIGGVSSQDFPAILTASESRGAPLTLPCATLRDVLAVVAHAMMADDARPHLSGTYLDVRPTMIRAVATDGKRLAIAERAIPAHGKTFSGVIVPRAFLDRVRAYLDAEGNATLMIGRASDPIGLTLPDGSEWTTKSVDAAYPSYEQVVPQSWAGTITVARQPLIDAVRACAIGGGESGVRLRPTETSLAIETRGEAEALVTDAVDALCDGDLPAIIEVPGLQLAQSLSALSCESVEIRLTGELDPLMVVPSIIGADGAPVPDTDRAVIMPMRPIGGG